MVYLLFHTDTKPKIAIADFFNIPTKEIINFFLAGFFIPMASPELWQRVYAIENQKHFKRSLFLSSVFYFIIGFILLMIGMVIRIDIPDISADTALIVGFSKLLPAGLAGLSVVIIYSAVSSSADTYMFTTASSVTQDILEKSGVLKKEQLFKNHATYHDLINGSWSYHGSFITRYRGYNILFCILNHVVGISDTCSLDLSKT